MQLTLVEKRPETRDVTSFVWRPDTPLRWRAGQFLDYTLPHPDPDRRGIVRYFTIASAPFERHVMLTTRFARERGSSFKRALMALPIGAAVTTGMPDGDFVIDDPGAGHVLLAGGIGVTPFRSMLLDWDHTGLPVDATLIYANRTPDFVYRNELEALAGRHPRLAVRYLVAPAAITDALIRDTVPDVSKPVFHVSGPEPFVEAMERMLDGLGVPEARVRRDWFPGYDWP